MALRTLASERAQAESQIEITWVKLLDDTCSSLSTPQIVKLGRIPERGTESICAGAFDGVLTRRDYSKRVAPSSAPPRAVVAEDHGNGLCVYCLGRTFRCHCTRPFGNRVEIGAGIAWRTGGIGSAGELRSKEQTRLRSRGPGQRVTVGRGPLVREHSNYGSGKKTKSVGIGNGLIQIRVCRGGERASSPCPS